MALPVKREFAAFKSEGMKQYLPRKKRGLTPQCKQHPNIINTAKGTTMGLHVHLKTKHAELLK
jgi:hypothetical protein